MAQNSRPEVEADELLDLPELDGDDERDGLDDPSELDIALPDAGDARLGDGASDELPLDAGFRLSSADEPSVLGDDADGFANAPTTLGLRIQELTESMLDRDQGELGSAGEDEALGIEALPADTDRTDADGLEDSDAQRIDDIALPVLDQGDDGEIDVGIELEPLSEDDAPAPADDDDTLGPLG